MLHEFIVKNKQEIVDLCRTRAAQRLEHAATAEWNDDNVALFLDQMVEQLRFKSSAPESGSATQRAAWLEMRSTASLHGIELLKTFVTVHQVVYEYGDICQSVTQLAQEQEQSISAREFGILNLCLDFAIADAVATFGAERQRTVIDRAEDMHTRLEQFSHDHIRLLDVAGTALVAMRTGAVGVGGATSMLIEQSLEELGWLVKHMLPDLRLALAKTTVV